MNIQLHTTPQVFDALASEWQTLIDPLRSDLFFMRPDWQRLWWDHLHSGQLTVVTVRHEDGQLYGIAPFFLDDQDGHPTLCVIGGVEVTDYIDLLLLPGHESMVLDRLIEFLLSPQMPHWETLSLRNVPEHSCLLALLPDVASQHGLDVTVAQEDVCPVINLPESYDHYLSSLDKKDRHELRRKRRKAEAHPVGWYTVGPDHNLHEEIDAFLSLMAISTPDKAEFLKEAGHRAFFHGIGEEFFRQGILNLSFLTVEGRKAAALWAFAYQDRFMLYNSGLNMQDFPGLSAGIVLLSYSIEQAIQRGFRKYDFLQGDEEYKYRLGAQTTTVYSLTVRR